MVEKWFKRKKKKLVTSLIINVIPTSIINIMKNIKAASRFAKVPLK